MKRIILMILKNIFYVPAAWIKLCYYASHREKYEEIYIYDFLRDIVRRANKAGNVKLEGYGIENIPSQNGFMLFPNHQGLYDLLALSGTCPKPISAVAKIEIANIPGIKQVMKCIKGFYMDRNDIRQSMEIIKMVTDEVKLGRNYTIFAEGTRSKNGNHVLDFKGGSFKAATKARCPIVPVALIDSFKPFDTNDTGSVEVQVHYLEPILYEEYKDMKTAELAVEVKRRIEEAIEKNEKEE